MDGISTCFEFILKYNFSSGKFVPVKNRTCKIRTRNLIFIEHYVSRLFYGSAFLYSILQERVYKPYTLFTELLFYLLKLTKNLLTAYHNCRYQFFKIHTSFSGNGLSYRISIRTLNCFT